LEITIADFTKIVISVEVVDVTDGGRFQRFPVELVVEQWDDFFRFQLVFLDQFELKREGASCPWNRIDPDLTIVLVNDMFGNHQAKTNAIRVLVRSLLYESEEPKQFLLVL
jgi:hypothetical protein